MIKVGVAIPSLNEEAYIEKLLASLSVQTVALHQFFVVIADNGSTDRTLKVIEVFKRKHKSMVIKVVQERTKGVLFARKRALDTAVNLGATILMTTDADCVVGSGFVGEAITRLAHAEKHVLFGHTQFPPKFKLFMSLYLSDIIKLERKLYMLQNRLFGPIAYGSHIAMSTKLYKSLYFGDMPSPLITQDDLLISRRCYYQGAIFIHAHEHVIASDRRFWGNISAWMAHIRVQEFRHVEDQKTLTLTRKQIAQARRKRLQIGVERIIISLVDALHMTGVSEETCGRATASIIKTLRYFHLPVSYVRPISMGKRRDYAADFTRKHGTAIKQKLELYVKK